MESDELPWSLMVTARAPSNIAVIKYWGKRDVTLNLPLNSSLSVTLDPNDLAATTTVAASPNFTSDRLWLNGKEVSLDTPRYQACLTALRKRAADVTDAATGVSVTTQQWKTLHLHIVSRNNFPTAAGLASSAAGFACLVFALSRLMGVQETYPGELSAIARQGSGSACRSLMGGFVAWDRGQEADGSDSIARQVAPESHWPDLCTVVAVVSSAQKETSSTSGMQQSAATSALLRHRAEVVVPARMREMEKAIKGRDFQTFSRVACADSNQFHSVCLDTLPPIFYMNDVSKRVIKMVHDWNESCGGEFQAGYTFDAGPNAVIFVLRKNLAPLLNRLLHFFPPPAGVSISSYLTGNKSLLESSDVANLCRDFPRVAEPSEGSGQSDVAQWEGKLQYLICTQVGSGAQQLEAPESHLVDKASGLPVDVM